MSPEYYSGRAAESAARAKAKWVQRPRMKSKEEIKARIQQLQHDHKSILTGSLATIAINAPRALVQLQTETTLNTLHWVLGTNFKSKLRGTNI